MHGGTITAASEGKNRGATFTVTLPAAKSASRRAAPRPHRQPTLHCDLLLVEDHADTRNALARLLKIAGCVVVSAATVAEALDIAATQSFDLVLSDIGLPDASGLHLMRELKARHGLRGIALTGYGMDDDISRCKEAGFDAHLTKPVDFQVLEQMIQRMTRE
jgi:CheY-like chemotaxis protein